MSLAWTMRLTPRRRATAWGRKSPCVSETTPTTTFFGIFRDDTSGAPRCHRGAAVSGERRGEISIPRLSSLGRLLLSATASPIARFVSGAPRQIGVVSDGMPTAKKISKAPKSKPKAKTVKAKTAKADVRTQPRAAAKKGSSAQPRKASAKTVSKGKSTVKAAPKAKARPKSAAAPKPKTRARAVAAPKARTRPKVAASPKPKARAKAPAAAKSPPRRDGTGHLDPKYARDLRALSRENHDDSEDRAFIATPRSDDDLAEELGEEAVETMTSGEDQSERLTEGEVEEERGGPFVKTRGDDEFASGTDRSNPSDATREPFPRT
jgi:hypothetical protein